MQNRSETLPDNTRTGSVKVIHDANAGAVILSGNTPPDDPRLWDIIERWEALTDAVRDQLHGLVVEDVETPQSPVGNR